MVSVSVNKKAPQCGAFFGPNFDLYAALADLTDVLVDRLMQMPDPAFLIAGENDLAGR